MKRMILTVTLLVYGCYQTDMSGDPKECQSSIECDDGDLCTFDYCEGGECAHQDICEPPPDCESAADCDDADECTLDYCDMGSCMHEDICPEPECDPLIRMLNLDLPVSQIDMASNGGLIVLAMVGADDAARGFVASLDPSDTETEIVIHSFVEDENQTDGLFVAWRDEENPRLFWNSLDASDNSKIMTAEFKDSALTNEETVYVPDESFTIRLNDVKLGPDGIYGITAEVASADGTPRAHFIAYSPETEISQVSELSPRHSHLPVLAALADGWSLGFTERNMTDGPDTVFFSQYRLPSDYETAQVIVNQETVFATRAMINTSSTQIVLYESFMTEDINQLFAGWIMEDGTPFSIDLDWQTRGVDALGSYAEERAMVSWCSPDVISEASSIRVSSLTSTSLFSTEFRADTSSLGCAKTQLVALGTDIYIFWLSDDGMNLSMKNLSCH